MTGSLRFGLEFGESSLVNSGLSEGGNMYFLGTLVMPLSERCFTPFWYRVSACGSASKLASIAVVIEGDMVGTTRR